MATDKVCKDISRRSFMKRTAVGGAGLVIGTQILSRDGAMERLGGSPKAFQTPSPSRFRI